MPLGHWLKIHYKKVLIPFLREMKKTVNVLIAFFYLFLYKFSLNGLLINALRALVSISHIRNSILDSSSFPYSSELSLFFYISLFLEASCPWTQLNPNKILDLISFFGHSSFDDCDPKKRVFDCLKTTELESSEVHCSKIFKKFSWLPQVLVYG